MTLAASALSDGGITVAKVTAGQDGWIVAHLDEGGKPGKVIGDTAVKKGDNANVVIKLSESVPAGGKLVAAPWVPAASLGTGGKVRPEFLWSALDCPGYFAFDPPEGMACLLGEMAADLSGGIAPGERCVVIGWELARDGRRHYTGTALFGESGDRRGVARATWFELATETT